MGKGEMNIWIKDQYGVPIQNCWKVELLVRTFTNVPLVQFCPSVVQDVQAQYAAASVSIVGDKLVIVAGISTGPYLEDISIKVPPGCYKIKARVCFNKNEDTNEVCVMVRCEERTCVCLLLPEVMDCGKGFIHPGLIAGLKRLAAREMVKEHILFMEKAAEINIPTLRQEVTDRITEATTAQLTSDLPFLQDLGTIIDELLTQS